MVKIKKDNRISSNLQNTTLKTKDRVTLTPLKTVGDIRKLDEHCLSRGKIYIVRFDITSWCIKMK